MKRHSQERKPHVLEFGHHIQSLIDYTATIQDRTKRNRAAQEIIEIMIVLNPMVREIPDYRYKLWCQLFALSGYKLDVDSPYEITYPDKDDPPHAKPPYPKQNSAFRYYGNYIKRTLNLIGEMDARSYKDLILFAIANHMKKCFLIWNKNSITDDVIAEHISKLSDGKLAVRSSDFRLSSATDLLKAKSKNGYGHAPTNKNYAKLRRRNRKKY